MKKITVATSWLDGCSGCHMSFLDMDQRLLELAEKMEIVYGPFVDGKELPKDVDVGIIEGAVSNEDDVKKALKFRKNCKFLVSLGDCAVSGNIPSMRNVFSIRDCLKTSYHDLVDVNPKDPDGRGVPLLKSKVRPLHHLVPVDLFVQGCPPSGDTIYRFLKDLLDGKTPNPKNYTRFGA